MYKILFFEFRVVVQHCKFATYDGLCIRLGLGLELGIGLVVWGNVRLALSLSV